MLGDIKKYLLTKTCFKNFLEDESGSILMQMSAGMFLLIGIMGIGVDLSRAYLYRSQLSGALDAAALAGAKSFHSSTRDAEIQAFFDGNFNADFMGGEVEPLTITEVDRVNRTLSVSTSGKVDTAFMQLFGWEDIGITAAAETTSKQVGLQLVMVLDGTGSMRAYDGGIQRMAALRQASNTLVDNLFGDESSNDKLQVGIIPYVTTVNVGHLLESEHIDLTQMPRGYANRLRRNRLDKWHGCVEARSTHSDLSSAAALDVKVEYDGHPWTPFLWRPHYDNNYYSTRRIKGPNGENWPEPDYTSAGGGDENYYKTGPNVNCPAPALDFSSDKSTIKTYIDENLYYSYNRGGTIANIGLIWGWRMLHTGAPLFNDVAYDDTSMAKAVILMTDGLNHIIDSKWPEHYDNRYSWDDYYKDNYDDDGDGRCPGPECSIRDWDWDDENEGPNEWDSNNGSSLGRRYYGDYSGYGRRDEGRLEGATDYDDTRPAINKRISHVCAAMKGVGITVYTITFGSGVNGGASDSVALRNLYEGCATDEGKYFHAPSASELDGAFEAIANDLSDLRLSK